MPQQHRSRALPLDFLAVSEFADLEALALGALRFATDTSDALPLLQKCFPGGKVELFTDANAIGSYAGILLRAAPEAGALKKAFSLLMPGGRLLLFGDAAIALDGFSSWHGVEVTELEYREQRLVSLRRLAAGETLLSLPQDLQSEVFSLKRYASWLGDLKSRGYRCIGFDDAHLDGRTVLLRHDVDFDPECALQMAQVEARYGLNSTYFFLVSGRFYNAFSPSARKAIRNVAELGHGIGLHVDQCEDMEVSRNFLQSVSGVPVRVFSQHDPEIRGLDAGGRAGWINAYDAGYLKKNVYRSDSGKRWRGEDEKELLEHMHIYALIHPELWVYGDRDVVQLLRQGLVKRVGEVRHDIAEYVAQQLPYLRRRL